MRARCDLQAPTTRPAPRKRSAAAPPRRASTRSPQRRNGCDFARARAMRRPQPRRRAARRVKRGAPASAAASALPSGRGGRWSGSSSPSSSASRRCRIASAGSALTARAEPLVPGAAEPVGALGAAPELPCGGQEPPCTSGRGASRAASSTVAPGALKVTSDAMATVRSGVQRRFARGADGSAVRACLKLHGRLAKRRCRAAA